MYIDYIRYITCIELEFVRLFILGLKKAVTFDKNLAKEFDTERSTSARHS